MTELSWESVSVILGITTLIVGGAVKVLRPPREGREPSNREVSKLMGEVATISRGLAVLESRCNEGDLRSRDLQGQVERLRERVDELMRHLVTWLERR